MSCLRCLDTLSRRQSGQVAALRCANVLELQQLIGAGLRCNARIEVLQSDSHHMLIQAGMHELALDRKTAARVLVRVVPSADMETVS